MFPYFSVSLANFLHVLYLNKWIPVRDLARCPSITSSLKAPDDLISVNACHAYPFPKVLGVPLRTFLQLLSREGFLDRVRSTNQQSKNLYE